MSPKIPMTMGLVSAILAFLCIFLPWQSIPYNWYLPMWHFFDILFDYGAGGFFAMLRDYPEMFLFIATGVFLILGENLGLIGSVTITKQKGRFSPLLLLVGSILSILSPITFVIALSRSTLAYPHSESFLSFGFWLELVAGILMLIASILGFVSLRKKPMEATIPPPPPSPAQIS